MLFIATPIMAGDTTLEKLNYKILSTSNSLVLSLIDFKINTSCQRRTKGNLKFINNIESCKKTLNSLLNLFNKYDFLTHFSAHIIEYKHSNSIR